MIDEYIGYISMQCTVAFIYNICRNRVCLHFWVEIVHLFINTHQFVSHSLKTTFSLHWV